jgi:hypothetical protein
VNVYEPVVVEVVPARKVPTGVTAVLASAVDAMKVKSEATSVALMPALIAFFHLFKSCTSSVG